MEPTEQPETIDQLAAQWLEEKANEDAAKKARAKIEAKLLPLIETKAEGAVTTKTDSYKITATGKINRKLKEEIWEQISGEVPPNLRPVSSKTVLQLDEKGVKWLEQNEPDIYKVVVKALDIKQAKTGIKIELQAELANKGK